MTMNPRVQCLHSFESNVCRHWQVAIKVIDTKKIKDDYIRNNLHREARVLSQLRHPNIVRLFETLKVRVTSLNLRILYCMIAISSIHAIIGGPLSLLSIIIRLNNVLSNDNV